MMVQRLIKSILDRVTATLTLLLLLPILLIVALFIYFDMGYPMLFAQPRPGKNSHIIDIDRVIQTIENC
ncbi:MAG: hypothetical protein F6J96_24775 [Symploca sp. SIO1C2]|nr:hypothetical protein [Symploca sp. SIO1C2]